MAVRWNILYRGPLDSCNYDCGYCPFAKRRATPEQLADDRAKLARFVAWAEARNEARIGVLFTPWGEALVHRHYQEAMAALSRAAHVERVAIQTNLSASLGWLDGADAAKVAFWATWHPSQTSMETFLARCAELDARGVRYSVGVVGLREHFDAIERLRAALPPTVYLWVNAYKDRVAYYEEAEARRIEALDPLFGWNRRGHKSHGQACFAGETSFAVDGDGAMFRCHFVRQSIGNIYEADFATALRPRQCPRLRCNCHLGYVNLKRLKLDEVYGDGVLERIPDGWPAAGTAANAARTVHA